MSEDITADSLQKLHDSSTRIDERVKTIQEHQKNLENSIGSIQCEHTGIMQRIAVLESKDTAHHLNDIKKELNQLEKRLNTFEASTGQSKDRWNRIFTFMIQIIWVILAAWLLMKLGLQAPSVP